MTKIETIKDILSQRHSGDKKQLEVIFSEGQRLLVVAPAGYGKTQTMISKIAYMLAINQVPNPKRLLALTFSVNAAYKIKKDVSSQIPEILQNYNLDINKKLFVSNYHGFCRNVLKKYGYLIHDNLRNIDTIQSIDDSDIEELQQSINGLSFDNAKSLSDFNDNVKSINGKYIKDEIKNYNYLIIKELLSRQVITFNSILTLTIKLFNDYPKILDFYHNYFTSILVDEYQDTNILSYKIINLLVVDKTKIILLGDSLQRIYGFIGAIPNLLNKSKEKFKLIEIELSQNYRFKDNQQMLLLDSNIRRNAERPQTPIINENAKILFNYLEDQKEEANYIIKRSLDIQDKHPKSKIVILVKQRGNNIDKIMNEFQIKEIPFFYGLFTDEDKRYVDFHKKCLLAFIKAIKHNDKITNTFFKKMLKEIESNFPKNNDPLIDSLKKLLNVFFENILSEYGFLTNEDKLNLIKDTFEYNGLRQYLEFIDEKIIISTVHGAKGLEWDYVILPDMEAYSFPNYHGLCSKCSSQSKQNCDLIISKQIENSFLEELSVFYVAVTRARKQVFFTASKSRIKYTGQEVPTNISCFLKLEGLSMK